MKSYEISNSRSVFKHFKKHSKKYSSQDLTECCQRPRLKADNLFLIEKGCKREIEVKIISSNAFYVTEYSIMF